MTLNHEDKGTNVETYRSCRSSDNHHHQNEDMPSPGPKRRRTKRGTSYSLKSTHQRLVEFF